MVRPGAPRGVERDLRVDRGAGERGGAAEPLGFGVDEGARRGHEERGVHPVAGDVSDRNPQPSSRQREVIVVVPAGFVAVDARTGDIDPGELRRLQAFATYDTVPDLTVLIDVLANDRLSKPSVWRSPPSSMSRPSLTMAAARARSAASDR